MTVDQMQARDAQIAELESLGDRRSAEQQDQLLQLVNNRDFAWRRLEGRIAAARRKAAEQVSYARQIGLPLDAGEVRHG